MILCKYKKNVETQCIASLRYYNNIKILEIVIDTDFRSNKEAIHHKAVVARAFVVVVIASIAKTESSGKLLSSLPSDTRTQHDCITFTSIKQFEVTSQIHEQRELLSDGTTHIADIGFKVKVIDRTSSSCH